MTYKVLGNDKVNVNLAAGANSQVFGTLYTVPAGKTAIIAEINIAVFNVGGGAFNWELYVLKSGDTDLTAAAADSHAQRRALQETKRILPVTSTTAGFTGTSSTVTTITRRTVLSAGDALKLWVHYGAVTPGSTDAEFTVSGDES